jgi:hypothetical protein
VRCNQYRERLEKKGRGQRHETVPLVSGELYGRCRQGGSTAVTQRTNARAADLVPIVRDLQAAGARSLRAIAVGLNQRGVRTPRGIGRWGLAPWHSC